MPRRGKDYKKYMYIELLAPLNVYGKENIVYVPEKSIIRLRIDSYMKEKNKFTILNSNELEVDGHVILSCDEKKNKYIKGVFLMRDVYVIKSSFLYYTSKYGFLFRRKTKPLERKLVCLSEKDLAMNKNKNIQDMFFVQKKLYFVD